MKTGTIIILSVVALFVIVLIMNNQRRQRELMFMQQQQQFGGGGFINTACKDNWLCATSTILGGLGGILQGVNFNTGGSNDDPGTEDIA